MRVALGAATMLFTNTPALIGLGMLLLFGGVVLAGPLIAVGGGRLLRPLMRESGLDGAIGTPGGNPSAVSVTR